MFNPSSLPALETFDIDLESWVSRLLSFYRQIFSTVTENTSILELRPLKILWRNRHETPFGWVHVLYVGVREGKG